MGSERVARQSLAGHRHVNNGMKMDIQKLSIRQVILTALVILTTVAILQTTIHYHHEEEVAREASRQSLSRVIEISTSALLGDLGSRSVDVAYQLASRPEFNHLNFNQLTDLRRTMLSEALHDPMDNGFALTREMDLVMLRLYDERFQQAVSANASSLSDTAPIDEHVRQQLTSLSPIERLKAQRFIWQSGQQLLLTVWVPVGGLTPSGFLEFTIDPFFNLSQLTHRIQLPMVIRDPDGTELFNNLSHTDNRVMAIPYQLFDDAGQPSYRFEFYENQDRLTSNLFHWHLLTAVAEVLFILLIFAIVATLLNRFVITPIQRLVHRMHESDSETMCSIEGRKCLREVQQLADAFCMLIDKVKSHTDRLTELSLTDGLTGIANRRRFDESLQSEWYRSIRHHTALSVLLIDVDHFKRFNDSLGHQAGDECLQRIAKILGDQAQRATDLVARYGGEEFAMLLPDTDEHGAEQLAKSVLSAMERESIPHPDSPTANRVTLSIGCATLIPQDKLSAHRIVGEADRALYLAKETGRNRYCRADMGQQPLSVVNES